MAERPRSNSSEHDLFGKIDQHKSDLERLQWNGTFEEYVDMVVANPDLVRTSHKTVYNALTMREDLFTTGRNALYGAEAPVDRFLEVLKAGSEGLEIGKRIILLVGPPGGGKSTLLKATKRALEEYSKTDDGALYAIDGCPMHEDPLHLIPDGMRKMLAEDYDVHIDGDLCPQCAKRYGGDNVSSADLKNVPVKRVFLSEDKRVGIGTFKPSDPKSQDVTELVGSINLSNIGEYGSGSDPDAYLFDGELNKANRGIIEFVEMLKSDERFLYTLLDLAQDRVIKSPRFSNISADEVILAHTNLAEYHSYVSNPKNEALRDRMVVIEVPYSLKVSDEYKIHEKLIGESEQVRKARVHVNPHSLETAAIFAVLSRIKPSPKQSKLQKLKIYDGQDVPGLTRHDIKELREEHKDEGMSGISPRYIIDSLSLALTKSGDGKKCLTPIDTIRAIRDNLDNHPHTRDMKKEDKEAILADLATVKSEYDEVVKREIQAAFVHAYEDNARTLSDNYLENVEAFLAKTKLAHPITGEDVDPDEKLMRGIEEQIGVSEGGKREFRNELLNRVASILRKGGEFSYESHPRLKEAIEKKLFGDMKDMVKLTTSSMTPNKEQKERIQGVAATLVEERGYCEHCAEETIKYVGSLLSRA